MSPPDPPNPLPEDPLELLLPEADERRLGHARRVAQFLSLLAADAAPAGARRVGVGLAQARGELERETRRRVLGALDELLTHHLLAQLAGESFLCLEAPRADLQGAWALLEELREDFDALPGFPEPGESALEVARRLCAALQQLGATPAALLWGARLARAEEGAATGERAFRLALQHTGAAATRTERARFLAGLVGCLLDRGAVRAADLLLAEEPRLVAADLALQRLRSWTRLLSGEPEEAGLSPWQGWLPDALVELREDRPELLPHLSGRAWAGRREARGEGTGPLLDSRAGLGASVLCVFLLEADRYARPVLVDVAPALRGRVEAWLADRDGACAVPSQPEHELVIHARCVLRHRVRRGPLRGVLGAEATRATALAPLLDDEAEVCGWLWIETDHHLLPARRRLEEWARAWRAELLRRHGDWAALSRHKVCEAAVVAGPAPTAGPLVEAYEALIADLGIKLGRRRWWGLEVVGGEPTLAASGGELAAPQPSELGGGKALARALQSGGLVAFHEPDARLSLHPRAASGVVLPLAVRGETSAALVLESERRGDFRERDLERLRALTDAWALPLRLATFRAWHRERYGYDVHYDCRLFGYARFLEQVVAAGRSRATVVLSGPAGAGKKVLARWMHYESGRGGEPLATFGVERDASLAQLSERARGSSLLFEDLSRLSASVQAELLALLEGEEREAQEVRFLAVSPVDLGELAGSGVLRRDLAARLDRLQLYVPPLCDRREEIPGLLRFLLRRFAAEEGVRPPRLTDEAVATLWRQPWRENLRELESFAYKLVLLHPGRELSHDELGDVARRFRYALVPRLPSRHPRKADLVSAIRSTLKGAGRVNKSRAALYLGWDPDTLSARLADAGLEGFDPESGPAAWEL